jgi:hypothetical protein
MVIGVKSATGRKATTDKVALIVVLKLTSSVPSGGDFATLQQRLDFRAGRFSTRTGVSAPRHRAGDRARHRIGRPPARRPES